ncbi:MAG: BrnT family toxin [Betaproteobacteria bacterium]|nr:BrnT family toxin [Betaproteobacteria bacterium]
MEITFDPAKNAENRKRHGVSLSQARSFEWETSVLREDDRASYGERRFEATGFIGDQIYVFVFCLRDEKIRAISLRKALPREARRYANH